MNYLKNITNITGVLGIEKSEIKKQYDFDRTTL